MIFFALVIAAVFTQLMKKTTFILAGHFARADQGGAGVVFKWALYFRRVSGRGGIFYCARLATSCSTSRKRKRR